MLCAESIHNQFLAQIKAHPDSDEPRLIFADWLEEHRDPLGEFIRLQCMPTTGATRQQRRAAAMRADDLRRRFAKRWIGFAVPDNFHVHFRRGFPEEATLSGPVFVGPSGYKVLEIEMLRDLRIVNWQRNGQGIADVFANNPCRAQIQRLRISNCGLGVWEIRKLFKMSLMRHVRELDLSWNRCLCVGCIKEIAESPMAQRLEVLDIRGAAINRGTVEAILGEPALERLRLLSISRVNQKDFQRYEKRLVEKFGDRITFQ